MSEADALIDDLRRLEREALGALTAAADPGTIEAVRIEFLGRKEGRISGVLRGLGGLDPEDRPRVGQEANRVKAVLESSLERVEEELRARAEAEAAPDLTLPGRPPRPGGIHPVTRAMNEIREIFLSLGFTRARGPEVETEWYNFEALNTPLDHPAADEQDTLYLEGGGLLRSHTSPVQIRMMQRYPPPIRIIAPGWVYRRDTWDATHSPAFQQIEGLVIDEGITFVDFRATLAEFARRYWGPGTKIRLRPSFFPFTEPSAEVDVKRVIEEEDGSTRETEWLEIMGAGMVDPNVLEAAEIDPDRYSGFAFGMGPGRIAMLRYGVTDLRNFFENDVRFLSQFGGVR